MCPVRWLYQTLESIKKCGVVEATNLLTTAGGVPTHTVEPNYPTLFDALQYCGNAYRALLHRHGAVRSQGRRGECYDNALPGTTQAESLWSRFKTEELERREWPVFANLVDAQARAATYFDFYNHNRLHSSIGYQFPYHAHQQLLQTTVLNYPG